MLLVGHPRAAGLVDAVGSFTVLAHDPKHRLAVALESAERALARSDLRGGGVCMSAEDRGERCADRPTLVAVVGNPELHQQGAEIGVAQAERPEIMAVLGDFVCRVACEVDRDVHRGDEDADRLAITFDVEASLRIEELRQVDRR